MSSAIFFSFFFLQIVDFFQFFQLSLQNIIHFSLLSDVLGRFEQESQVGDLIVATLCLLEASSSGLLESELMLFFCIFFIYFFFTNNNGFFFQFFQFFFKIIIFFQPSIGCAGAIWTRKWCGKLDCRHFVSTWSLQFRITAIFFQIFFFFLTNCKIFQFLYKI